MHVIDWLIVALPIIAVIGIALYTRRYLKSVADFMAGGRNAGRFLLCTARSEMGAGAVAYVSNFEAFAKAGFVLSWWGQLSVPILLILSITGFVIYRYRQTRALTLAQFFEMRYSRRFRLFTGGLAVFAGLVNFGIIPVIGAKLMVYFVGFPQSVPVFSFQVPTYLILMGCFLTICAVMTIAGGQITVLVADCAEGMFSQIAYVIIAIVLIVVFSWPHTRQILLSHPPGQSLVNPFHSFSVKDFNIWYVLMGLCTTAYTTMAWQNSHAFNASAATPHESRMGGILGRWRGFAQLTMVVLLGVCAMTYLGQVQGDASVQQALNKIPDARTAGQMRYPIALAQTLPVGVKGLLVSIILMGIFSGDGMQLHSWSSIFIQDVVLPLRKTPLTTRQHLLLLRLAIVGVAIFAFCFGALFRQTEYVSMWFIVTESIFTGGAGACIIGGLYWNRGTTAGAWTGLLTGSILATGGILLRQVYPAFPLNGREIAFSAALAASAGYIVVSLLTCREPHNMDRLLHRGAYAVEPEAPNEPIGKGLKALKQRFHIYRLVGIDEHFSRSDRWITIGIFLWSITWFLVFLIGTAGYFLHPWSDNVWANYWLITAVYLPLVISVVTTIWFTIGCWHDMRVFFRRLKEEHVDSTDDGTVVHGAPAPVRLVPQVQPVKATGNS